MWKWVGIILGVGGLAIAAVIYDQLEQKKDEGFKEGQESASREYEEKLRKKAQAFMEQKERMAKQNEEISNERDEAIKLAEELMSLVGQLRGIIEKEGYTAEEATIEYCEALEKIVEQNILRRAA